MYIVLSSSFFTVQCLHFKNSHHTHTHKHIAWVELVVLLDMVELNVKVVVLAVWLEVPQSCILHSFLRMV